MRKILASILLLVLAMPLLADNIVTVSSVSGKPDEVVTVDVGLANTDEVSAVELRIPLNRYFTLAEGTAALSSSRSNGHSISAAKVGDELRIYVYSTSSKSLKGNDGSLLTFGLKLGKSPERISLTPNVLLSNASGQSVKAEAKGGEVTILVPHLTIGQEKVDFGHVPIRQSYTQYVTLRNSGTDALNITGISFSAKELTTTIATPMTIEAGSSRQVEVKYAPTVRGAISETMSVQSNASNGTRRMAIVADPFSVNELHVEATNGDENLLSTVILKMNNMEPIVGAQCTFDLPEELAYVEGSAKAAERAEGLTAVANVAGQKLTLFLYSQGNKAIPEGDGSLMTFKVRLNGRSGYYQLTPKDVVLSNAAMENMTSATSGRSVYFSCPTISCDQSLDMGSVAVGMTVEKTITVRNSGQHPLVISKVAFLDNGFSLKETLPLTIDAGRMANLTVCYAASKEGSVSTQMNIYSNDPDNGMKPVELSVSAYEDNRMSMTGQWSADKQSYQLHVALDNYTKIVGAQMDVHVPEGMTVGDLDAALQKTDRMKGLTASVVKYGEQTYRVVLFSFNNTAIGGNEGDIFTLSLDADLSVCGKKIWIDNIVLSNVSSQNYVSHQSAEYVIPVEKLLLTYKVDGEVYKQEQVAYGATLTAIDAPTKEGYTFSGWSELPATMPAKDVEITGSFIVNQYRLSFVVDGDTLSTTMVDYGTELKAIDAPVREGMTFSDWSTLPGTMPARDVVITGTFSANSYKILYKVDGQEYQEVTAVYGTSVSAIDEPTKEGYTFSGWSELPATMPAKDVEITGSFIVNQYRLSFVVDGDTLSTAMVDYGTELKAIDAPVREGMTFSGWSTLPKTMPAKDVVITGTFTANSYKIIYKVDGQTYQDVTAVYGTSVSAIDEPTKEGYTFGGWSEIPEAMPAKDVEIVGSFVVNQYRLSFVVEGDTLSTTMVDYGTELKAIDAPAREGMTFSGWSTLPKTMPAKDVIITGTFSANSYKIIYKVDGQTYQEVTSVYGSTLTAIDEPTKEGYTFSGWSEIPETMPASDLEIVGSFVVNQYRLSFVVEGDTLSTTMVDYGTELRAIDAPVREGETFSGWSTLPKMMPAKDVVITGTFSANSYKLTYKVDDEIYEEFHVVYGSSITAIDEPTKEGYTFSGWSELPATMPAKDVVITGSFTVNQYRLSFVVEGDTLSSEMVDYGTELKAIDAPVREGETFSGWSTLPKTMPARDVVITGTFSTNSYKLTYKIDGEIYEESHVVYGSSITAIDEPTKEGYTFSGWSEMPETMPAKDVEITGSFTVNQYRLSFVVDGDTLSTTMVDYGTELRAIDAPVREGETFSGWSTLPKTMPARDVVITGTFSANSYKIIYKVDGQAYQEVAAVYGSSIPAIDEPTKEGYTFSGWSEIPEAMPAKDVEITGSFIVNQYRLSYVVDGDTLSTAMVDYGTELKAIDAPVREGETFSGWSTLPKTMPARDVVITGTFSANSYKLTYKVDGEIYEESHVVYGSSITAIDEPTKEGHTFSGWSELPETMPAKDVEITGSFIVNQYRLSFVVEGDTLSSEMVDYGTELKAIDAPVREGMTFSGWSTLPKTMPARDVVITGTFSANSYKLTYKVDGEIYEESHVVYGSSITANDEPTKEGYTFSGWSEIPETMPASDVEIVGSFIVNQYRLSFVVDGDTLSTTMVDYGEKIVPIETPAVEGYSFVGWNPELDATMPAHDVTYDAVFSLNTYAVIYIVGNDTVHVDYVEYGAEIPTYTYEPEDERYEFVGWIGEEYTTMPAKDIVYVADRTDGIATAVQDDDMPVYNLRGVKVGVSSAMKLLPRGIYVVGGRKVIVK